LKVISIKHLDYKGVLGTEGTLNESKFESFC